MSLVCISTQWAELSINYLRREVDPLLLDDDPANGLLALSIPQLLELHHIGGYLWGKMYEARTWPSLQAPLDLDLFLLNDFLALEGVGVGRSDNLEDLPLLDLQLLNLFVTLENRLRGVVITLILLLNNEAWHHILMQERVSTLACE